MSILEYRAGCLKKGLTKANFEKGIVSWFRHLSEHQDTRFQECLGARCFRQCDEEGNFGGPYVIVAEYRSLQRLCSGVPGNCEARGAAAADGPLDPRLLFTERLKTEYLQSQHEHMWFDFSCEKLENERRAGTRKIRYLEYEHWKLAKGVDRKQYEDTIDVWFNYVVEHKRRLFDEWVSARYYRKIDINGNPTGGYAMIFEYSSHKEFQAYKKRRRHSYDTNTGDYLAYRDNDPYQFFNPDSVHTDGLWPLVVESWFN